MLSKLIFKEFFKLAFKKSIFSPYLKLFIKLILSFNFLLYFKSVLKLDSIKKSDDNLSLKSPSVISIGPNLLNIFFTKTSVLSAKKLKLVFSTFKSSIIFALRFETKPFAIKLSNKLLLSR